MKVLERELKALANRRRLALVGYLKFKREANVSELARAIKLSFRSTSKHLGLLVAADLLEKDQRGLLVFYRLNPKPAALLRLIISLL